jgi:hypothetical protein
MLVDRVDQERIMFDVCEPWAYFDLNVKAGASYGVGSVLWMKHER